MKILGITLHKYILLIHELLDKMRIQNALLYTVAVAPSLVLGEGCSNYSVPEWHPPTEGDGMYIFPAGRRGKTSHH